ncbi:unnamed protein product [Kuraishia capsulata CBS 1993]|uniref:E3 ubiquitin protein ligase n=1 Tax=Kuraishia capsulata CBS 1993 TaxID=1382522 RepID=W6MQ82_9ASCO|nr:uncharacterized protein KUCA_T00003400001 [Kuraishia capsulata CBS 1993]CDK27422.1 unnamed protein product [Kuraishia capsulata CBS 1993]
MSASVKRTSETDLPSAKKPHSSSPGAPARSGPLTQADVIHFKKQAIWRCLNQSRTRESLVSKQLETFQKENKKLAVAVSVLSEWYEQIYRTLAELYAGKAFESHTKLLDIPQDIGESLQDKLSAGRSQLLDVLQKLPLVPEEFDASKLEELNDTISNLEVEKNSVLLENKTLQSNLEKLEQELLSLLGEQDRAGSDSLQRVNETAVKKETEEQEVAAVPSTKSEETSEITSQEVEDLKLKAGELEAVNQKLTTQLDIEIKTLSDLKLKYHELNAKILNLTETDLETCVVHQQIVKDNERLKAELSGLNLRYEELCQKLDSLNASTSNSEDQEHESAATKELARVEGDLVRIRTQRDELLSKNSVLVAQQPSEEIVAELQNTIKILEQRLADLEREKSVLTDDLDTADAEQIKKQNKILAVELKQLEEVFKNTKDLQLKKINKYVENEQIINKLTVERTKAVEKYFATMRLNESLQQENRALKSSMSKQGELINTLKEVEKQISKKSDTLEKQLQLQFSSIERGLVAENKHHTSKIDALQNNIKILTSQNQSVTKDLNKLRQEVELEKDKNKALELESSKVGAKLKESQKLITKYRANGHGVTSNEEDDEIKQALLSMAKCSLCNKNWKDTTFKTCGHCFCSSCVKDRLDARMRKCPSCNHPISAYDVLPIHL